MEITLKVLFGVTDRFEKLAEKAIGAILSHSPGFGSEPSLSSGENATEGKTEAPAAVDTPSQQPATPEPATVMTAAPATPAPAPAAPESTVPDDETMRTMMDIAISKVCGTPDWKESQDARIIDLRRSCTQCFREISKHLGSDKPTALKGEQRNKFLSELENIYEDVAQRRAVWKPF